MKIANSSMQPNKKPIQLEIDKAKGLDLKQIGEKYCLPNGIKRIFCVGDNGIGKSYSVEDGLVNDYLKKGIHSTWIRNTEKEIRTCINGGKTVLIRHNLQDEYEVEASGVGKKKKEKKKDRNYEDYMISFIYLSSPDSSVPQGVKSRFVVFDEIIAGNEKHAFTMQKPLPVIRKIFSRITRPVEGNTTIPIIMLSNPHSLESDILPAFGIDFDYEKLHNGKDQMEQIGDSLLLVFPKQFTIEENRGLLEYGNDLDYAPENYFFPHPEEQRLYSTKPDKYDKLLFNFTAMSADNDFSVGGSNLEDDNSVYVSAMDENDIETPTYCVLESHKNYHNIYLPKVVNQMEVFYPLCEAKLNCNKVYYDCLFTKKALIQITILLQYSKRMVMMHGDDDE